MRRTSGFISTYDIRSAAVRLSVVVLAIGLVAVAFVLAAITGGQGTLFLGALIVIAALLIGIVFFAAFAGTGPTRERAPARDFLAFEEATGYLRGGGLPDGASARGHPGLVSDPSANEATLASARAFVRTLVPAPSPLLDLSVVSDRKDFLNALRREGTGLIRLAKVTGVDVTPYQDFLVDARGEAVQGDWHSTLRSLQLANELLRATIVKVLMKRKRAGEDVRGLEAF